MADTFDTATWPVLESVFQAINNSAASHVINASQAIGTIGDAVTAGSDSLKSANSLLGQNWNGAASAEFLKNGAATQNFGRGLGGDLGSLNATSGLGVSALLSTVADCMKAAYQQFTTAKSAWANFRQHVASQIVADASKISNTSLVATTAQVSYSDSGFGAKVLFQVGGATVTTALIPGGVTSVVVQSLTPGTSPDGKPAQGGDSPANLDQSSVENSLLSAEVDQYLALLRTILVGLGGEYGDVESQLPNNATGPSVTANGGGNGPGNGALPVGNVAGGSALGAPNVPTGTTGVKGAPLPTTGATGTSGAAGSPPSSAALSGANTPTAGAGGTGSSGTGGSLSGASTPTSLASAPTTSTPPGLSGSGTSGLSSGGGGLGGTGGIGSSGGLSGVPTGLAGAGSAGAPGGGAVPIFPIGSAGAVPGGGSGGFDGSGGLSGVGGAGGFSAGIAGESSPSEPGGTTGDGVIGGSGTLGEAAAANAAETGTAAASTATGRQSPYMPYMPMSQGMSGANEERSRSVWLDEEDDVWSAGTDPAPAVIGGEA
jgi:hypothetical protein